MRPELLAASRRQGVAAGKDSKGTPKVAQVPTSLRLGFAVSAPLVGRRQWFGDGGRGLAAQSAKHLLD